MMRVARIVGGFAVVLLGLSACAGAPEATSSSLSAASSSAASTSSSTSTPTSTLTSTPTGTPSPSASSDAAPVAAPAPAVAAPTIDGIHLSLDDPNSLWVISDKHRPLNPTTFVPSDLSVPVGVPNNLGEPLREEAARAVETMHADAVAQGVPFRIVSGYRSYDTQVTLYNSYVLRDGQTAADTYSARPGFSEHQTGLAVDFDDRGACFLDPCFESTAAGQWLAANAPNYGFVLRYPKGQDAITGFTFEPWHFRYIGVSAAQAMRDTGVLTLEQFFGLNPAPDYL